MDDVTFDKLFILSYLGLLPHLYNGNHNTYLSGLLEGLNELDMSYKLSA